MNPITTTSLKAHRALILRALIALFVALSIAAADPVDNLLGFAADQIEQRASIESGIAGMIQVHRVYVIAPSGGDTDVYTQLEFFYRGRASAMREVSAYLRSFQSGGGGEPPSVP